MIIVREHVEHVFPKRSSSRTDDTGDPRDQRLLREHSACERVAWYGEGHLIVCAPRLPVAATDFSGHDRGAQRESDW